MTMTSLRDVRSLFELMPGKFVSEQQLREWLPDVKMALWFAKVYELDYQKVSELLSRVFKTDVISELMRGGHSAELQDYLVDVVPDYMQPEAVPVAIDDPPPAEILPEMWESLTITVAKSIQDVAAKLSGALAMLPSKEGRMLFQNMAMMDSRRPTLGVYKAQINHAPVPDVLVILDVSGSMTKDTVATIINDVVALSWTANAHLAIVSDHAFHWEPGTYNVLDVLAKAEYYGTHYEQLAPLFNRDWGTVVTIADYDSSRAAYTALGQCSGRVGTVLDISLVPRSTFLAECVGQLADTVRPLLISWSDLTG